MHDPTRLHARSPVQPPGANARVILHSTLWLAIACVAAIGACASQPSSAPVDTSSTLDPSSGSDASAGDDAPPDPPPSDQATCVVGTCCTDDDCTAGTCCDAASHTCTQESCGCVSDAQCGDGQV